MTLLYLLGLLLLLNNQALANYVNHPEIYFDRVTLWSEGGEVHETNKQGYNFTHNWKKELPAVTKGIMGLQNFQVAANRVLSYELSLRTQRAIGAIQLWITNEKAGIIFLSFSVVVRVYQSEIIQFYTFTLTDQSKLDDKLSAKLSKGQKIHSMILIQWLKTTRMNDILDAQYFFKSRTLKIWDYFTYERNRFFKEKMMIHLCIINKNLGVSSVQAETYKLKTYGERAYNRFGIDDNYGSALDQSLCIHGLTSFSLKFSSDVSNTEKTSFLFVNEENSNKIAGISMSNVNQYRLVTSCFAYQGQPFEAKTSSIVVGLFLLVSACFAFYGCYKNTAHRFKTKEEMMQLSMNQDSISDFGTWKKVDKKYDSMRMCVICKKRGVDVQTHCWHFMHLKCMLEWTRVNNFCPICKDTIDNRRHQFYCVDCGRKQIDIHFKEMVNYNNQGRLSHETTCDKCKRQQQYQQQAQNKVLDE